MVRFTSFQFHKGTIRTNKTSGKITAVAKFQFHKGTIRTTEKSPTLSANSISIP